MKLLGGLNLDAKEVDIPEGSWIYAKNIVISDKFGSVINEEGFKDFSSSYANKNLTPIGVIEALDVAVIFSAENEIGILKQDGNYETVLNSPALGFDIAYPIKGTFKYNRNGDLIVSFIADNISPMLLNLNKIPSDLTKAKIFPNLKNPFINLFTVLESGGTLSSGVYYFSVAYRNNEYNQTNWLGVSNPISIIDSNVFNAFNTVDGCEAGTPTSKAISLTIENVDISFDKLVISVISKIGGTIRAFRLPEVEITGTTTSYLYTGNESLIDIAIDDIVVERPFYTSAKAITQLNDRLLLGNVTAYDNINYQPFANQITTSYVVHNINPQGTTNGYKNSKIIHNRKGFMDGDVYAFYIALRFIDGSLSRAFHIPGRAARAGELDSVTLDGLSGLRFQLEDTADPKTQSNPLLGYWQNATERYPNNSNVWGSLAGQLVRHHKMPTIEKIGYSAQNVESIGIKFDNIQIPAEINDIVQGYEIFYAKKTISNSQVIGQDIVLFAAQTALGGRQSIWTTGGNWLTNPQKTSGSEWFQIALGNNYLRLHSFDILRLKPQIEPTHIVIHKRIRKSGTNLNFETFGKEGAVVERSATGKEQNTSLVFDYTSNNTVYTDPASNNKFRKIQSGSLRYLPCHTNDGDYNNWFGEDCALVTLSTPGFMDLFSGGMKEIHTDYKANGQGANPVLRLPNGSETEEETYLISIYQLKLDVYNSFSTQPLISTGFKANKSQTSIICFGGDTFINNYSFITTAPRHRDENPVEIDNYQLGVKVIRNVVVKSYSNIEFRYQDGRDNTKYYPRVLNTQIKSWLKNYDRTQSHIILYNSDYNSVNDIQGVFPETYEERPNSYPHRIIQSIDSGRESELDSWNRFLANDYYEVIKNKGEILNLVALNNNLIIHLERDLLRTVGNENLSLQGTEVFLGSGKLFQRPPVSIVPDDRGYAGLISRFACVVCKLGYIFIDNINGKVFILSGDIQEISNKGIKQFLRNALTMDINKQISEFLGRQVYIDNPFVSAGTTVYYEENYNRIVISKKDFVIIDMNRFKGDYNPNGSYSSSDIYLKGNTLLKGSGIPLEESDVYTRSFSISYSVDLSIWVAFHDYIFDKATYIMEKNLLIKNKRIYETNQKNKRAIYFDSNPNKSIIIPVFNSNATTSKLFTRFNWITDLINAESGKEVNKTVDRVMVFSATACSGNIDIVPFTSPVISFNARKIHDSWNFNEFRDIVINTMFPFIDKNFEPIQQNLNPDKFWFEKGRFVSSWIAIKIEFFNSINLDNSQNVLYLYDISAEASKVTR